MEEIMRVNPVIRGAMKELKKISSTDETRELLRLKEKAAHDNASRLSTARRNGFQEGKAEGLAEGEARGEARGEALAKHQVLQALLKTPATASLSDAELAAMVALPLDEVTAARARLRPDDA
jgi:flagellar biosynthesis/type III secretory pathway protein FliH